MTARENLENLLKLMQKNPDLPVVPIANRGMPKDKDGWDRLLEAFGKARTDEYLEIGPGMVFKSTDNVFDVLRNVLDYNTYKSLPGSIDECRPLYNALPWKKAIIVNIDPPEEE